MFFTWGILFTIFGNQGNHFIEQIIQTCVINYPDLFYKQINFNLAIFGKIRVILKKKICFNRYKILVLLLKVRIYCLKLTFQIALLRCYIIVKLN